MSKLILMSGIPGSGKSYWAKQNMPKDYCYISRDVIRFSFLREGEEYFSKETQVFNTFIEEINTAIAQNRNVIADATHLNPASREKVISNLTKRPDEINVVYMNTPLEVSLERNSQRAGRKKVPIGQIHRMYKSVRLPLPYEDIDFLTIVSENGVERKRVKNG